MAIYPDLDALEQLAEHVKMRRADAVLDARVELDELTVTSTVSSPWAIAVSSTSFERRSLM